MTISCSAYIEANDCSFEVGPKKSRPDHARTSPLNKVAEFKLKYRTKRALQSLMVIERSPSLVPLADRPVEELSREELMKLERRRRVSRPEQHQASEY